MKSLIDLITQFYNTHPVMAGSIVTWFSTIFVSSFVSAFTAPTKDSSPLYVWWFRFSNSLLAGNFKRAQSTAIESSPNWKDAVDNHVANLKQDS